VETEIKNWRKREVCMKMQEYSEPVFAVFCRYQGELQAGLVRLFK